MNSLGPIRAECTEHQYTGRITVIAPAGNKLTLTNYREGDAWLTVLLRLKNGNKQGAHVLGRTIASNFKMC